ncbi:hypothetical protein B0H17DRAFT_1330348 [Mycena rosella]|uniref:Uncharacterized protein n=1 Tax=Mycena rosella TaxID=1033263 RepID=A0AAD7DK79_MYCRO|nr:hypothetical protein B0H17DRAFT_1330348 [Mycena rosella]
MPLTNTAPATAPLRRSPSRLCLIKRDRPAKAVYVIKPPRIGSHVIEAYLQSILGITDPTFTLEDDSNIIYLSPELCTGWDVHALFAIVLCSTSTDNLIALMQTANDRWQKAADFFGRHASRSMNPGPVFRSFQDAQYEVLILHPRHFLPCGETLSISQIPYTVTDMVLKDSAGTPLPTLINSQRPPLNPFLVTINAHSKITNHLEKFQSAFPPHSLELIEKTST